MSKGIVYIMTTAVAGLIKIGQTETKQFNERMRYLENNGYHNVSGLKRYFAIEIDDYTKKEKMIHEIFSKSQVSDSELFALSEELVKQLLLSFDGNIIYPKNIDKEKEFDEITEIRESEMKSKLLRSELGIKNGDILVFKDNENITCENLDDKYVKFEGEMYSLSGLTYEIMKRLGKLNKSGHYNGNMYWIFNGKIIAKLRGSECQ